MSSDRQFSKDRMDRDTRGATGSEPGADDGAVGDTELEQLLRDFRLSVHAWSDAVYQRPRRVEGAPPRMAWRRAAGWVLGSVLVVGGVGGGLLEYRHQQEQARIAAAREAERQREIQEQRTREAEQELAQVDTDVSREVPSALEPLGQLMTADESK